MTNLQTFKNEFKNLDKMKIFEIQVIDKRTNETDHIIFEIEIYKNSFQVQFEPLTKKQEKSKKIAHFKQKIDVFF